MDILQPSEDQFSTIKDKFQDIFDSLELNSAVFEWNDITSNPKYAFPYNNEFMKGTTIQDQFELRDWYIHDKFLACGSIAMSMKDYAKWISYLLKMHKIVQTQDSVEWESSLISFDSFKQLFRGFIRLPGDVKKEYGLGIFIESYRGKRLFQHGGNLHGAKSEMCLFPDDDFGVAFTVNSENHPFSCKDFADSFLFGEDDETNIGKHSGFSLYAAEMSLREKIIQNTRLMTDRGSIGYQRPDSDYIGSYTLNIFGDISIIVTISFEEIYMIVKIREWPLFNKFVHWKDEEFSAVDVLMDLDPYVGLIGFERNEGKVTGFWFTGNFGSSILGSNFYKIAFKRLE